MILLNFMWIFLGADREGFVTGQNQLGANGGTIRQFSSGFTSIKCILFTGMLLVIEGYQLVSSKIIKPL